MSSPPEKKSLPREIGHVLASNEFAILLLILLAIASLFNIGVGEYLRRAVPRWQSPAEALGPTQYVWFVRLGLFHPYSSWWYATLLGLLCLSLLVCSIARLKRTIRRAFSIGFKRSPEAVAQLPHVHELRVHGTSHQQCAHLRKLLGRRLYRSAESAQEATHYLAAHKGGFGRLGALFAHAGIIALLMGGIIGARTGYSTIRHARTGEILDVPRRTFRVRVDSLWMDLTEGGEVRDWYSKLAVLDPDSVTTQIIEVNRPLRYQGISFYQFSWGEDPRHIVEARLGVDYKDSGQHEDIAAPFQEPLSLADGTTLRIADFVADFFLDEAGNAQSRSTSPRNPAILLELSEGGVPRGQQWLFLNYPQFHRKPDEKHRFYWLGYEPVYVTGLQMAENPGAALIWLGIGLATVGVCLAFLVDHRRIWAVLAQEGPETVRIVLGGRSHKNTSGFAREFKGIIQAVERKGG